MIDVLFGVFNLNHLTRLLSALVSILGTLGFSMTSLSTKPVALTQIKFLQFSGKKKEGNNGVSKLLFVESDRRQTSHNSIRS